MLWEREREGLGTTYANATPRAFDEEVVLLVVFFEEFTALDRTALITVFVFVVTAFVRRFFRCLDC